MKQVQRLAVIGFGRLGRACARVIMVDKNLELAGIIRRADSLGEKLPPPFVEVSTGAHISELRDVDAAVICVPTLQVFEVARELLQHCIPVVECATLHEEAFQRHKQELDRLASITRPRLLSVPDGIPVFYRCFADFFSS